MTEVNDEVYVFPASFAQQRLWFLSKLAPENPFYTVPAAIRFVGNLDVAVLERAFNEILDRHETLRTTFEIADKDECNGEIVAGQLMQVVAPRASMTIKVIDLQNCVDQAATIDRLMTREFKRSFNRVQDTLIRVELIQLARSEFILLLTLDHIVCDGWSIGILIRELGALYTTFLADQPSPLSPLPIQYADFAIWQRQQLNEEHLHYWKTQLADLPTLKFPTDRLRPAVPTYRGKTKQITLSSTLTRSLLTLSQEMQVTLFMTLLAAFQILLSRYTGQTDIVVGTPIANRTLIEVEPLIGFFVNNLVLRTDLSQNPTFRELLLRVQATTLKAYEHQDVPFEKLVEAVQQTRDLSRHPLFQIVFALQNTPIEPLALPGLTLEAIDVDAETSRVDLEVHCFNHADRLHCKVIYSTDLFEADRIDRLLHQFQTLLNAIVNNPDQKIADLTVLTSQEQQLLKLWSQPKKSVLNPLCIHQIFEQQVLHTPDAVALVCEAQSLTYQELNNRANQVAHQLQQCGVGAESLVGLCVDRTSAMIIAILGIWKSGGAYLPLDPDYPVDRLTFMLQDSKIQVLVTQTALQNRLQISAKTTLYLDSQQNQYPTTNPSSNANSNTLAYVIYTSGSTGKPNGVLIEHRGVSNLVQAQKEVFAVQRGDRVLQFASSSFDASIFELALALTSGATLYIAPQTARSLQSLVPFLQHHAITHITLPPAILAALPDFELPALTTVISAGEACSASIVDRWSRNHAFFNAYGPTEATVWATVAQLFQHSNPSIGQPICNTEIHLLDANRHPVPIGAIGELYIGGIGLARGYLNRDQLTQERFITHQNQRFYKTGDLARYGSDGTLTFVDRIDAQIKLRGVRIEPGEIEAALNQHPNVEISVVVLREKQLVAYVVAPALNQTELEHYLRSQLPSALIPIVVQLDALPLTVNGKLNRTALPDPAARPDSIPPKTPAEIALAQIWTDLLDRDVTDVRDNFFTLGGDSLQTLQLLDRVQQHFNQSVSVATLFLNPTVAQLSAVLQAPLAAPQILKDSPLVPLRLAGSKPPFFCIHPVFGVVLPYAQLAYHLDPNQPFYGLQSVSKLHSRLEDLAADYIKAIRSVQPDGPYLIGGWSFGGLVAFEMAQQLDRAGQSVALLALIDTVAPIARNQPSFRKSLQFLIKTALPSLLPLMRDYLTLWFNNRSSRFTRKSTASDRLPRSIQHRILAELTLLPMLRTFYANSQAAWRYRPNPGRQPITLFQAQTSAQNHPDSTYGWQELTIADVKIHSVIGNHFSMLYKPSVASLAAQLQSCINQVQR